LTSPPAALGTYLINKTVVLCDGEYGVGQYVSLVGEGRGKGSSSKLVSHNATAPVFLLGGTLAVGGEVIFMCTGRSVSLMAIHRA
jgi:hypothetical protein